MRTRFASVVLVGGLVTVALFGLAHAARAATGTIEGELTALSGTTLPATLTVQDGVTSYTVNVTSSTALVRKFGGPSTLDEFVIGDTLQVTGDITGTTIDATKIKDTSIQRKGAAMWGTVLSIDATAKTFVLDPMQKKSLDNQTVEVTSTTKVFQGNRTGAFGDISVGMTVKVIGLWRKSLNKLVAERILIKVTEVNGTVTVVDCTSTPKTIAFTTKSKGHGTTTWTAALTDATVLRDKALNPITCTDVKAGHQVQVRGLRTGTSTLNALQVYDKGAQRIAKVWNGTILSLDGTAKTFVVDVKGSDDVVAVTTAETIYVNEDGTAIAFTDLVVGHKVQIRGTLSGSNVTANLIIDKNLP